MSITTSSTNDALAAFAGAATPPLERRAALTVLITHKVLPKQADDPAVAQGRAHLLAQVCAPDTAPEQRLLSIAECIRLTQVVKRWTKAMADQLGPALAQELPPMQLLPEADDRLNLARSIAFAPTVEWVPPWLARAIAEEETGEKARAELLSQLVQRCVSLADAMRWLVRAFSSVRPATESPGDTLSRRLTRTLSAWREVLRDAELPAGEGLGTAMYELLALPLAENGKPQQEKVRLELCEEALTTVHDSVRTRISLAADPDVYTLASYCRRLCGAGAWPAGLHRSVQRLVADVGETIVLLGRQGQRDQRLLDQLQVLCDTGDQARKVARALAVTHAELPEPVRDWLMVGHVRVQKGASEEVREAALSNADASIGLALAQARQLAGRKDSLAGPLTATLDLFEPTLLGATEELLGSIEALTLAVDQLAQLRGVELFGLAGDEVDVDAKFFEVASSLPSKRMTVRQPAVVKLRADGSFGDVLVKGVVA